MLWQLFTQGRSGWSTSQTQHLFPSHLHCPFFLHLPFHNIIGYPWQQWNTLIVSWLPDSPAEQALDGVLEEISLGELNISNKTNKADAPPAIPIITKTLDLDTESLQQEGQSEKKTKKKGVKKAQGKCENHLPVLNVTWWKKIKLWTKWFDINLFHWFMCVWGI